MKESVAAVFVFKDQVFTVKRQDYLRVFPGYTAFPGGKVDASDHNLENLKKAKLYNELFPELSIYKLFALERELEEELNFSLYNALIDKKIKRAKFLGVATSPSFNPYRFNTHFFLFELDEIINFDVDTEECLWGKWQKVEDVLIEYEKGERLIVPPLLKILDFIYNDLNNESINELDLNLLLNEDVEIFMIESIYGVKQFFPLSNTFPPANRTNCFLIGDQGQRRLLVDPSPKDENELEKLIFSTTQYGFDAIFLTHHHPDHHQFSTEIAKRFKCPILLSGDTYKRLLRKKGRHYFKGIDLEFLSEGQIVTQSLGIDIKVFEVPGHDEGQLALAPVNKNWFIVGDLIQTIGTVVIGGNEGNMGKYYHSLERIIDLNPAVIFPSHGIALGGVHKLIKTLDHRKKREKEIYDLLKKGKSSSEILNILYFGVDKKLHRYALKVIEAHIDHINENNTIQY